MSLLTRYRPLQAMESLRQEVDDLFTRFFPGFLDEEAPEGTLPMWKPRTDLSESNGSFILKMDLPGLKKEEITVNVEDHRLTVSGERKEEKKEEKENYLRTERSYGSFYRSFTLPSAVKEDQVKAEFKDGVLTVTIPKTEKSQPRSVSIT